MVARSNTSGDPGVGAGAAGDAVGRLSGPPRSADHAAGIWHPVATIATTSSRAGNRQGLRRMFVPLDG